MICHNKIGVRRDEYYTDKDSTKGHTEVFRRVGFMIFRGILGQHICHRILRKRKEVSSKYTISAQIIQGTLKGSHVTCQPEDKTVNNACNGLSMSSDGNLSIGAIGMRGRMLIVNIIP